MALGRGRRPRGVVALRIWLRLLPAGAVAGWGLHPLESAAFARRTQKAVILGSSPSDQTGPGRYRVVLIAREENGQPAQGRAGVPSATAPLAKPEDVDEELQGRGRGWPRHRARRPSALKRLRSRS